jgi:GTP-binding protein YchF
MNLKIGIVGLPNAGKSTLFNALLKRAVANVAPYPFCTIEPNIGVVPVPDVRLLNLAEITKIEENMDSLPPIVPAVVEFVDIAGLVKGASQGEGLGNKFLSHIREVHIIVHVLRYFDDPSVVHVAGTVNPERDKEIIETELILADLQTLEKQAEPKGNATKEQIFRWSVICKAKDSLNNGKLALNVITDPEETTAIRDLQLLTMKPILYVANVSENQFSNQQIFKSTNDQILLISAKTESELASLTSDEQIAYLRELGLESSGLDRLIRKSYETLGLISFLTCGVKEVRAWTIRRNEKALMASGEIHTDFMKKFIKADVISYRDFVSLGGWKKSRDLGKVRSEGKDYCVQDGDVIEFKIET